MHTDRTIPVEDTDQDQMDTLEDDILSDQIDVLGTGIEKEKNKEEEEKAEVGGRKMRGGGKGRR